MSADLGYFGDGSFEKPKIMFYFTKPCPTLKIESAITFPDFGFRPAFQYDKEKFECDLCGKMFPSVKDMVKHWQEEMRGKTGKFSRVDFPLIEVKPGGVSVEIEKGKKEHINESYDPKIFENSIETDGQDVNKNSELREISIGEKIKHDNSVMVKHRQEELRGDMETFSNVNNPSIEVKPECVSDDIEKESINENFEPNILEKSINTDDQEVNQEPELKDTCIEEIIEHDERDIEINKSEHLDIKTEFEDDNNLRNYEAKKNENPKIKNTIDTEDTELDTTPKNEFSHEVVRYDCTFCNYVKTIGRNGLRKHIEQKHKEFSFELNEHKSYKISKKDLIEKISFNCKICSFNTRSPMHMRQHKNSEHPDSHKTISSFKAKPQVKEYFKEGAFYFCKSCDHRNSNMEQSENAHKEKTHYKRRKYQNGQILEM